MCNPLEAAAVVVPYSRNPDLTVRDVWFGRTVIRSRHQLHYYQAGGKEGDWGRPCDPRHQNSMNPR